MKGLDSENCGQCLHKYMNLYLTPTYIYIGTRLCVCRFHVVFVYVKAINIPNYTRKLTIYSWVCIFHLMKNESTIFDKVYSMWYT